MEAETMTKCLNLYSSGRITLDEYQHLVRLMSEMAFISKDSSRYTELDHEFNILILKFEER